jgi:uncharacterized protein
LLIGTAVGSGPDAPETRWVRRLRRSPDLSAADHRPDLIVGVILDPQWLDPDLLATLILWDAAAIKRVERAEAEGAGANLSCGYRYTPVVAPGTHQGMPFRGVMKAIVPNHCAMVDRGRVAGAMVGDAALRRRLTPLERATRFAPGLARVSIGYPSVRY